MALDTLALVGLLHSALNVGCVTPPLGQIVDVSVLKADRNSPGVELSCFDVNSVSSPGVLSLADISFGVQCGTLSSITVVVAISESTFPETLIRGIDLDSTSCVIFSHLDGSKCSDSRVRERLEIYLKYDLIFLLDRCSELVLPSHVLIASVFIEYGRDF